MYHSILSENQRKRLDLPLWMLICFSMFNAWQMGFIYFMGPSLVLDGRTPLPISMDNVTALIAAGYVLSILFMIALPHLVVWAARISTAVSLLSVIGLFFPLSAQTLTLLLYIQTFCCCFMIGFETFIISHLFTERSTVSHLTLAYSVALVLIAVVQNDLFPVSFPVFRLLTLIMLVMLLVFFFRLPTGRESCPRYVKKGDGLRAPRLLVVGIFAYSFVADIMMLGGPAAVAEVPNGVFFAYLANAVGAVIMFVLYRRSKVYPLHAASVFMALSVAGFLLLFLSSYLPALAYPACVLVGFGFLPCQFMPLYGMTLMKSYPSRYIAPGIIGMALLTVLVHSALVEAFRSAPELLHIAYLVVTVVCIVVYLQLAPYLDHVFRRKIDAPASVQAPSGEPVAAPAGAGEAETLPAGEEAAPTQEDIEIIEASPETEAPGDPLAGLTAREREVLELIGGGYSNRDIADILIISEHTVNDYTKKIYRKLNVHSRHAAAQIIHQNRAVRQQMH